MENKLLTKQDSLSVGDVLLFRNRFNKKKYAIMRVVELVDCNGRPDGYFYVECIKSNGVYSVGASFGCNFIAHCTNNNTATELTYIMPVGTILYGTN